MRTTERITMDSNSLTVTDNRTEKTYNFPLVHGCVNAMDLRQINTDPDDFGLMTYDPAFTNTASCRSAITYIDGEKGILRTAATPSSSSPSTALPGGGVPPRVRRIAVGPAVAAVDAQHQVPDDGPREHQEIYGWLQLRLAPDGHAHQHGGGAFDLLSRRRATSTIRCPRAADMRLIAKMPTIAAFAYRHSRGLPVRLSGQRSVVIPRTS